MAARILKFTLIVLALMAGGIAPLTAQNPPGVVSIRGLSEAEQRQPQNQTLLVQWMRSGVLQAINGRLDDLECRSLFSLGDVNVFTAGLTTARCAIVFRPGPPRTDPTDPPRLYTFIFPKDTDTSNAQLYHESLHMVLWNTSPDVFARNLGDEFYQRLRVGENGRDDDGHHVFLEAYVENAIDAYERLKPFEKAIKRAAEEERRLEARGQTLSAVDRERLYNQARMYYQVFLKSWSLVANFDRDPNTRQILADYRGATGIFFTPPPQVADFYRNGGLKLSLPGGGEWAVKVPDSVFLAFGYQAVELAVFDLGDKEDQGVFRATRDLLARTPAGILKPSGKLRFRLEGPDQQYTGIEVRPQRGSAVHPGTRREVTVNLVDGAPQTLVFTHQNLNKADPGPYRVLVEFTDPTSPATYERAETVIMCTLPELEQATLTITGPTVAESDKPVKLKAAATFARRPAPPVTLRWRDLTDKTELREGEELNFITPRSGAHNLEVEAVDLQGRSRGRATHTVLVRTTAALSIQGPSQALRSEVFTLEAVLAPDLAAKIRTFVWYAGDATNPRKHLMVRLPGLVAVSELAAPSQGTGLALRPGEVVATDRVIQVQNDGSGGRATTYLVEARDEANAILASKPWTVSMLPGYFTMDLKGPWKKVDSFSRSTLERDDFHTVFSLEWTHEGGTQPTLDDGKTTPGPAGFRKRASRFIKGTTGFWVQVIFPDPPSDPAKRVEHDARRRAVQAEIDAMLASLRITDQPGGSGVSTPAPVPSPKPTFEVKLLRTDRGPVTVGQAIELKATVSPSPGPVVYRWEPHPAVTFEPGHEGTQPQARARFASPGRVRLWVSVHDPGTGQTLAESKPVELDVALPNLKIVLDPGQPMVGQDVSARVEAPTGARLRWLLPAGTVLGGESPDGLQMTFFCKNLEPQQIAVQALTAKGEDLGTANARVLARSYKVSTSVDPPGSMEAGQYRTLRASIEPALTSKFEFRWSLNPGSVFKGANFGAQASVSRSDPGTLEATVIAVDARGVELGRASLSLPVTASVSAGLMQRARSLAAEGKFEESARLMSQVGDSPVARATAREIAGQARAAARQAAIQWELTTALQRLEAAAVLDSDNLDIRRELGEARGYQGRSEAILRLIAELEVLTAARQMRQSHAKLYEISTLQNRVPKPPGDHPDMGRARALYYKLEREYNEFMADFVSSRQKKFTDKDFAGLIALCDQALARWEHTEANEKEIRSLRASAADWLRQQSSEAERAFKAAQANFDAGRYEAALAGFASLLDNPRAAFMSGWCRHHLGDHAGAIADYTRSLRLGGPNPDVLYRRALCRSETGDNAGLREDAEAALALAPNHVQALGARSAARSRSGDYAGALQDAESALRLDPAYHAALVNRAHALLELQAVENDPKQARALLARALEACNLGLSHHPDAHQLLYHRARARFRSNDNQGCLSDLNRCLALAPAYQPAKELLASVRALEKATGARPTPAPVAAPPLAVDRARPADFVGQFLLTDPTRPSTKYYGNLELRADGSGRCAEYLDGKLVRLKYPDTRDREGYVPINWGYDAKSQTFKLDWTLGGRLTGLGSFRGRVTGNTHRFGLSGTWANGKAGNLNVQRK